MVCTVCGKRETPLEICESCLRKFNANRNEDAMGLFTRITPNEYQAAALRTANKALTPMDLLENGVYGLNGEAGEIADHVKKWRFQGHELDRVEIKKELGDVMWYVAIAAHAINVSLEDVMLGNVKKLKKRYPEGFSKERSINRED